MRFQRRIMWFLVHGGELRFVPEFRISDDHMHELHRILARLRPRHPSTMSWTM
jgi:hypothetical protein